MKYRTPLKHIRFLRYFYIALGLCGLLVAALADSSAPTRAADIRRSGKDGTTHVAVTNLPTEGALPPAYEGDVEEGFGCSQIVGWAWDRNKPNEPINVDIYDGATLIATVPANRFHPALLDFGIGNGYHMFIFNVPNSLWDAQSHSMSVKFGGTSTHVSPSPKPILCGASLFPTAVPQSTAYGQGSTWEQGVEFSSNMDGTITHIRFWRAPDEPMGNHEGTIWSATGNWLRSATFNETPGSGWQYATLSFPLEIKAGVAYKVTYNVSNSVSKTFNVFNGPITTGPLTAWGSSYTTPAGNFPKTGSTSNLFADIIFNSPR